MSSWSTDSPVCATIPDPRVLRRYAGDRADKSNTTLQAQMTLQQRFVEAFFTKATAKWFRIAFPPFLQMSHDAGDNKRFTTVTAMHLRERSVLAAS